MHVYKLNERSLKKIRDFYLENKIVIDNYQIRTFDFITSEETDITYTKAKLIDMCGFIAGQ